MAAIIIYRDPDGGESPHVEWLGVAFDHGEPVMVENADLIERARKNAHFEVIEDETSEGETEQVETVKRGPGRPRKVAPVPAEADDGANN